MKRFFPFAIWLWLPAIYCHAQTTGMQSVQQLQESPAGSKILAFVDFISSEDELSGENQSSFFSDGLIDRKGTEGLSAVVKDIRLNDGDLIIYQADRLSMFEYKLICKSGKTGSWLSFRVKFEEQMPYGIDGLELYNVELSNPPVQAMYKPKKNH